MMAEFQAAPGGGGGPSHLTSHEEGQLQSPLQSGRCLPPHYEKWAGHLVRWDGRDRNVAGNVNSNSGLPLPSCVFLGKSGLQAFVFPAVKWERWPHPFAGKLRGDRSLWGLPGTEGGSAPAPHAQRGRREGRVWGASRGTRPRPALARGAQQCAPRGPASLARLAAPTWLSAAAVPLPGSLGTFCANPPPGPTPRQTPGSRPEEAQAAPPEPQRSGCNLNTSPAGPPRHAPLRRGRGVLAPGPVPRFIRSWRRRTGAERRSIFITLGPRPGRGGDPEG